MGWGGEEKRGKKAVGVPYRALNLILYSGMSISETYLKRRKIRGSVFPFFSGGGVPLTLHDNILPC